jgi:hypothetical protein
VPKKSGAIDLRFFEKSDFSISIDAQEIGTQEIRFFGKIGFLNLLEKSDFSIIGAQEIWCPRNFLEKSDFSISIGAQEIGTQEIRFFGKIGFLNLLEKSDFSISWFGYFRFLALVVCQHCFD